MLISYFYWTSQTKYIKETEHFSQTLNLNLIICYIYGVKPLEIERYNNSNYQRLLRFKD